MALDFSSVKFLLWAKNLGVSFERTLTLGHQGLSVSPKNLARAVGQFGIPSTPSQIDHCFEHPPMTAIYSDNFFDFLGAKEIVTVDRSDFEGATLLHDLNLPFPENLRGQFDFVFDGGTLEHIFNYPAALTHCLELVKPGGHFVTITPAFGQMGHGFYQFSPELFFRVFSEDNGFALRKIILFDAAKADADFIEVKDPAATGLRTELAGKRPMQLAVLAKRTAIKPMFVHPPQQSDYMAAWQRHSQAKNKKRDESTWLWRLRVKLSPFWPSWLRRLRDFIKRQRRYGRPTLNNHRHFRKLKWEEIFNELD